jgi:hypothetical protein
VITVNWRILEAATSDSSLGLEIGGETLFNKRHERRVLKALHLFPNCAWNGQRKDMCNILAQAVNFLKKPGSHRVICAAQMENYKNDESFLLWRYRCFPRISVRIEDSSQFRLRIHSFPQIPVLLGQLNEVGNTASAGLKEKRDANQKKSSGKRAALNERKPIVAHPIREGHEAIIPNGPEVSSSS